MKITVLYFSEEHESEANIQAFPKRLEVCLVNEASKYFIDNSIFKSVAAYLDSNSDFDLIVISNELIPDWNENIWDSYFLQAKKLGSSIYRPRTTSNNKNSYLATFDPIDLRMAIEQNYRPVFENIDAAFSTFGFISCPFEPDNIVS